METTTATPATRSGSAAAATPSGSGVRRLNPMPWSGPYGFDLGQLRPFPTQLLTVAGMGSLDHDGNVLHEGDTAAQLALTIANIEAVLAEGGMTLADVTRLTMYAVDVDAVLAGYGALLERLAATGAAPPATLVGVTRLALPGMLVEIEATAAR
jgi:enamine deaminase RidA (YjgF/YER057c/UK114 family)